MLLCAKGETRLVKLIARGSFDINKVDTNQQNALFYAVSHEGPERDNLLRVLLLRGADYRQRNKKGVSSKDVFVKTDL